MSYFCKKGFMEVMDEDLEIYKKYQKGEDFNKALEEKREKEKIERENMEKEKLAEEKKKNGRRWILQQRRRRDR
jgi:hypothetical protein